MCCLLDILYRKKQFMSSVVIVDFIKINNLCSTRDTVNRMKRQVTYLGATVGKCISKVGLVCIIPMYIKIQQ